MYVGKAISLKDRVRSYFAKEIGRGPGIDQMVQEADDLDYQTTGSELEALLLEARLIRQYKPRYNIRLRDDKSFALIRIDLSQPFPPVLLSREKELEELLARKKRERSPISKVSQKIDQQEFFGPYLSSRSVRLALKSIRKIWPFRDCGSGKYGSYLRLSRGCDAATLVLCDAPCQQKVSQEEYRHNLDQVRAFLRGDREKVIQMVQTEMEGAAEAEQFEKAAKLRDRLQSLLHLREVAQTRRFWQGRQEGEYEYNPAEDFRIECYDISNNQGVYAVGALVAGIVRQAKLEPVNTREELRRRFYFDRSGYRKFKIKSVEGISDTDMIREVLIRRLKRSQTGKESKWQMPDFLLLDGGRGQLRVARQVIEELNLKNIKYGAVAKGPTRKRIDLYGEHFETFPEISREAWLLLAELLREEAHRFAISYYRRTHRKENLRA